MKADLQKNGDTNPTPTQVDPSTQSTTEPVIA
jgi:hypothetical protein